MLRTSFKYLALCVVAAALLTLAATRVDACGRCGNNCCGNDCGCGTNGSMGAYGTTGAYGAYSANPYGTGMYASTGAYGYGATTGFSNSMATNGGNCGQSGRCGCRRRCGNSCCGCSTGMVGSDCGCGMTIVPGSVVPGSVVPGAPPVAPGVKPTPAFPPPAPKSTYLNRPDAGLISIWVDEGAKVFVNGHETKSTGAFRQYMAYGLKPGYTHTNEIRAVLVRDGRTLEETRTVTLAAGQEAGLAISFTPTAEMGLILAKQHSAQR